VSGQRRGFKGWFKGQQAGVGRRWRLGINCLPPPGRHLYLSCVLRKIVGRAFSACRCLFTPVFCICATFTSGECRCSCMRLAASAGVGAMAAPGIRFALCIGSLQQRLPDFDWERKPGSDGSAGVAIKPQGLPTLEKKPSKKTSLPVRQATCDLCGVHGSTIQRLLLET